MKYWRCLITRWVADEPQPGVVEARALDAHGQEWVFVDKSAVFSRELLTRDTAYPAAGIIGCEVIREGSEVSTVTTVWSCALEAAAGPFDEMIAEGKELFDVRTSDLSDGGSTA